MNKVILIGRLCADPELRQTQSQIACCRFRIAVNRPKRKDAEQEADFINCTAWRQTAILRVRASSVRPISSIWLLGVKRQSSSAGISARDR